MASVFALFTENARSRRALQFLFALILESKENKATVPIYYEARPAKIELKPEERPKIDPNFEEGASRTGVRGRGGIHEGMSAPEVGVVGSDGRDEQTHRARGRGLGDSFAASCANILPSRQTGESDTNSAATGGITVRGLGGRGVERFEHDFMMRGHYGLPKARRWIKKEYISNRERALEKPGEMDTGTVIARGGEKPDVGVFMWQRFIFGMHWKHGGTMYYDELSADSKEAAAEYFIDNKRDDVALIRVEFVGPEQGGVQEPAKSPVSPFGPLVARRRTDKDEDAR